MVTTLIDFMRQLDQYYEFNLKVELKILVLVREWGYWRLKTDIVKKLYIAFDVVHPDFINFF